MSSGRYYDLSGSSISATTLRMCGRSDRRWPGRSSDSTCCMAPATIIIKMLICLPFSSKGTKLVTKRNVVALFLAFAISATGYYIAEGIMFGFTASFFTSVSGSIVQSGGSAIMFVGSSVLHLIKSDLRRNCEIIRKMKQLNLTGSSSEVDDFIRLTLRRI